MGSKILNVLRHIAANVGSVLVIPTTFMAFSTGVLCLLHVRAFVHGWNIARGIGK